MASSTHRYTAWIPGFVAGGLLGLLFQRWRQEASSKASSQSSKAATNESTEQQQLTADQKDALASTARALATRGKGILAADESTPTVRRFVGGLVFGSREEVRPCAQT